MRNLATSVAIPLQIQKDAAQKKSKNIAKLEQKLVRRVAIPRPTWKILDKQRAKTEHTETVNRATVDQKKNKTRAK